MAAWLNPSALYGNAVGEFIIVINKTGTAATKYDFLGNCNSASTGNQASIYTGQGVQFAPAATGTTVSAGANITTTQVSPTASYLQLIDQ
jgi:hypothetical protein